jgi:hypothetical protein
MAIQPDGLRDIELSVELDPEFRPHVASGSRTSPAAERDANLSSSVD